jgi:hypothetical protein
VGEKFLNVIQIDEVLDKLLGLFLIEPSFEDIPIDYSLGRFVRDDLFSKLDILPFDKSLKSSKINPYHITDYEYEEYTHLSIANVVKFGDADCGMDIRYVAGLFDLNFVSIKDEEYDLIILKSDLYKENLQLLLQTISSSGFKEFASKFKGYKYVGGINEKENQL